MCVTLLLCEIFVRVFFPQISQHDQFFREEKTLGWEFIPNHTGQVIYDGEVYQEVAINSSGFRDVEFSEKKGAKKIMFLGDSFLSNISVTQEEVFTHLVDKSLEDIGVYNLGVNGYGQVQEYLTLKEWFPKIQPDLIVLMIYLRNDFTDNLDATQWLYPRPTASITSDSSLQINTPNFDKKLKTELPFYYSSHLFRFVKKRMKRISSNSDKVEVSQLVVPEYYLCNTLLSEETDTMYNVMHKMLLKFSSFAKEKNTPIAFVLAPSIIQAEDALWQSAVLEETSTPEAFVRDLPNQKLLKFAEEHEMLMFDLLPALRTQQQKESKLYNPIEQHWTAQGNTLVAQEMMRFLNKLSY